MELIDWSKKKPVDKYCGCGYRFSHLKSYIITCPHCKSPRNEAIEFDSFLELLIHLEKSEIVCREFVDPIKYFALVLKRDFRKSENDIEKELRDLLSKDYEH